MSVHSWGEKPIGVWQLEIRNSGRMLGILSESYSCTNFQLINTNFSFPCANQLTHEYFPGRATLQNWSLVLYGTKKFQTTSNEKSQTKLPKNKKIKNNKKQKNKITEKLTSTTARMQTKANKNDQKHRTVETAATEKFTSPPVTNNNNNNKKKKIVKPKNNQQQKTTTPQVTVPDIHTKQLANITKQTQYFDIVLEKYDNISKIPQVFQQYSKFQHVFPAVYLPTNRDHYHDDVRVEQVFNKQKEISRININRNAKNTKFVENTDLVTSPVNVTTGKAKINTDGN